MWNTTIFFNSTHVFNEQSRSDSKNSIRSRKQTKQTEKVVGNSLTPNKTDTYTNLTARLKMLADIPKYYQVSSGDVYVSRLKLNDCWTKAILHFARGSRLCYLPYFARRKKGSKPTKTKFTDSRIDRLRISEQVIYFQHASFRIVITKCMTNIQNVQ